MTTEELFEQELNIPMVYITRNGVYYEVPVWVKEGLEVLDILKHCCQIRRNELLIYITDRTDNDIGNGVKEYEAFDKVKEWLNDK